jgi:hypothetical protein
MGIAPPHSCLENGMPLIGNEIEMEAAGYEDCGGRQGLGIIPELRALV